MRYLGLRKKCIFSSSSSAPFGDVVDGADDCGDTVNVSPAPSQSDDVINGGCTCTKPPCGTDLNTCPSWYMVSERNRARSELKGVRNRRWGICRRKSGEWYFF